MRAVSAVAELLVTSDDSCMREKSAVIGSLERRSQDFVWGCTFFSEKVDDVFISRRPQKMV